MPKYISYSCILVENGKPMFTGCGGGERLSIYRQIDSIVASIHRSSYFGMLIVDYSYGGHEVYNIGQKL